MTYKQYVDVGACGHRLIRDELRILHLLSASTHKTTEIKLFYLTRKLQKQAKT